MMRRCPVCGIEHTACSSGLVSMPRPVDLPPKGEIKMAGPTRVYCDERGNTFKATSGYAALHGWTLAEPEQAVAATAEPEASPEAEAKARAEAANKARPSSANK